MSKQRMMVCWLTLQILAASPVVNTVFMRSSTPYWRGARSHECGFAAVRRPSEVTAIFLDGLNSLPGRATRAAVSPRETIPHRDCRRSKAVWEIRAEAKV